MEKESDLQTVDPAVAEVINAELRRQNENIELIASENFTSRAVMERVAANRDKYPELIGGP